MTDWQDLFARTATRLPARSEPTITHPLPNPVASPWRQWWNYARASARIAYRDPGLAPPCVEVYGPVLDFDEIALLSANATYSRFYGADRSYLHSDLFVVGHPTVMIAAMAGNAVLNARRKANARNAVIPCWRSQQQSQIVATNHRLLCHIAERGWLSFYYDAVTEFYPDLSAWTLTLGFNDHCAPLRLTGPPVPAPSLWTGIGIEGARWHTDPRLRPLLT